MPQPSLVRSLSRFDLTAITINAIIGAGIFGLPAKVFGLLGNFSVIAFLVCAVFASLIVICFAEVGSRFSNTGGPYLYAREAFGPVVGFEAGWLMYVARVSAFAANSNLLVSYAAFFWPAIGSGAGRYWFLSVTALSLMAINIVGVRNAARANNLFTAGKLIPIALFIAAGLWFADWRLLATLETPGYAHFSTSVLLLVYAFTGFEMAVIPSGEIRNPQRNIPLALLTAIALVTCVYLLIQIVCIVTLPELAASQRPLGDAANHFLGRAGASVISAGIVISIIGNLHITILAASRIPFAMAEHGEMPRFLGETHPRFRTPHFAILCTGAIMLALALSGTFIYALTVSALARIAFYVTTCAAVPMLRRKAGRAPLEVPGGVVIAVCAILLAVWLLSNSSWHEARDTGIAAALGLIIFAMRRKAA